MRTANIGSQATRFASSLLATLLSLSLAACSGTSSQSPSHQDGDALRVTKASCGQNDHPETGLQGQATLAERFSDPQVFNCNLEQLGSFPGEGASFRFASYGDCVYYSTTPNPQLSAPGTVVLDISDRRHPKAAGSLRTPAMLRANESLMVHEGRKLLAAADFMGSVVEFYDVSGDCRHPVLKGSIDLKDFTGHVGDFSPDGRTFYTANYTWNGIRHSNHGLVAIDVSDPSRPRELARWERPGPDWDTHAAAISPDGRRVYLAAIGAPVAMAILDTGAIQDRMPGAAIRTVSLMPMAGTSMGQFATPMTIARKPYALVTAVRGEFPKDARRCSPDWFGAPYSAPRLVDISDEAKPRAVGYLKLEVNDPAQCGKLSNDPTYVGYGNLQCSPDDPANTKMLACAYGEGGLRVFDVRDVMHPRELAYYKPAAYRTLQRKGSYFGEFGGVFITPAAEAQMEEARRAGKYRPPTNDHTTDVTLFARFMDHARQVWFVSADGGFHIVRFPDAFVASEKELFMSGK